MNHQWTFLEVERALALVNEGLTRSQVADRLSVEFGEPISKNSVIGALGRYFRKKPQKRPNIEKHTPQKQYAFDGITDIEGHILSIPKHFTDIGYNLCHAPLGGGMCCALPIWKERKTSYCETHHKEFYKKNTRDR